MGFMGMFGGGKSNGPETGDWGSDMVGMMKMLAGMPHMMRKPMMKGRVNQLLSLSEEKRQESIREMIGAFHSPQVKDKARDSLVATRVEIVGDLPEEKRRTNHNVSYRSAEGCAGPGGSRPAGAGARVAADIPVCAGWLHVNLECLDEELAQLASN